MRRIIPIVWIGIGTLLILAAGGWLYLDRLISHPAAAPLPEQIAGLPMSMKMTGAQATEEFDMLHNQHFPLTSGAVGIYGDKKAALWVGGALFKFNAANMVTAMRDKISEGRSPFTPIGEFKDGGRMIYTLEGMGQKHYYFQSQNFVIWLAVDPAIADIAIKQILEAYP